MSMRLLDDETMEDQRMPESDVTKEKYELHLCMDGVWMPPELQLDLGGGNPFIWYQDHTWKLCLPFKGLPRRHGSFEPRSFTEGFCHLLTWA